MAFFQKFLLFALAPLIAFFALRTSSPDAFRTLEDALQPYIAGTPLSQFFADPIPPRNEIPLVFSSVTHQSHFEKIAAAAVALAELGYPITFICGRVFEDTISKLHPNIQFYPFQGLDDKFSEEDMAHWMSLPSGIDREIFATAKVLVDGAPDAHKTYQAFFQEFKDKYGDDKPLISLYDATVTGHQTFLLGVPGIKPDASIGIGLTPLTLDSNDTFPFRSGKKPHSGPDAREVHRKEYDAKEDRYTWEVSEAWWAKLKELGSPRDEFPNFLDGMHRVPDHLITIGIPEFEFPRSDLRPNVRYYGAIESKKSESDSSELSSWWDDIQKAKEAGKKIVAVSQGTVETNPEEIIIPTLDALKDREDVLVVATFYLYEPEEVPNLVVPSNARVAKYVPHDKLLPLVDVVVTNGGFGAVQKCIHLGLPMVISGVGQDKAAVAAIADYTGMAINLEAQSPGAEKIGAAVNNILENESYRSKAKELSKVFDKYDMQREFDNLVQDVVKDWQRQRKSVTKEL